MKAYEFLKNHDWCQGAWARNATGIKVRPLDPRATGFCLGGAVCAVYWSEDESKYNEAIGKVRAVLEKQGITYVGAWNDTPGRTKDEVLTVLEEAGV
jgi:hypothetical protein